MTSKLLAGLLFVHYSSNNLCFSHVCLFLRKVSSRLDIVTRPRVASQTHIDSMSSREIPLFPAKERGGGREYFGVCQNFPTKLSSEATMKDEDDDNASTRIHPCACLRKVMVEQLRIRVYVDRTTYTCRIDDLFRHVDVNFSHLFHLASS